MSDSTAQLLRSLTNDEQDPEVVGPLLERVQQVLTTSEQVQYVAVQKRPVVSLAPDCVVLTNRRFMVYRPTLLKQVAFEDYVWRDLVDARLQESLVGATLTFQTTGGKVIQINFLPKVQARRAMHSVRRWKKEYGRNGGRENLRTSAPHLAVWWSRERLPRVSPPSRILCNG